MKNKINSKYLFICFLLGTMIITLGFSILEIKQKDNEINELKNEIALQQKIIVQYEYNE